MIIFLKAKITKKNMKRQGATGPDSYRRIHA